MIELKFFMTPTFIPTEIKTTFIELPLFQNFLKKLKEQKNATNAWNKIFENSYIIELHHLKAMEEVFPFCEKNNGWNQLKWSSFFQYAEEDCMTWLFEKIQEKKISKRHRKIMDALILCCVEPEFDFLYQEQIEQLYQAYQKDNNAQDLIDKHLMQAYIYPSKVIYSGTFLSLLSKHPFLKDKELDWEVLGKMISKIANSEDRDGNRDTMILIMLNHLFESKIKFDIEKWSESFNSVLKEKVNSRFLQKTLNRDLPKNESKSMILNVKKRI